MATAPSTRPPLERMVRIHGELERGSYPNCNSLAEILDVSAKTVKRDIDFMRDRLCLPIEYDQRRHGYTYTETVDQFPLLSVTQGELLALFIAQQALPQLRGTPFAATLESAIDKLGLQMANQQQVSLQALSDCLSIRMAGFSKMELIVFQRISEATLNARELTFTYHKLNEAQPEERRVRPLHLANIHQGWYLFAHDIERNDLRTFLLSRIIGDPSVGAEFKRPDDFSITRLLADSFGVFHGTGNYEIHLHFDAFAARIVSEREWHDSQLLQQRDDGTLDMRLHLDSLEEIEQWVLSWGNHVRVLAPEALSTRVRQTALDVARADAFGTTSPSWNPPWLDELNAATMASLTESLGTLFRQDHPGQLRINFD